MVICAYSGGKRPKVPFPYFAEVMTGFEYSAAILMLTYGMVQQGVECIADIRRRYDGERRNTWDEAECGHHYARAMAAWSSIVMLSGVRYDGPGKRLSVAPRYRSSRLVSFFSTASAWGRLAHSMQGGVVKLTVTLRFGKLALQAVELRSAGRTAEAMRNGRKVPCSVELRGGVAVVSLKETVELSERDEITVMV